MSAIRDHLAEINERIAKAVARANRKPGDVRLLAVSKTQPLEAVREAFAGGQVAFGENYVQEAVEKARTFPEPEWHLIGNLQTNKIKMIAGANAPRFQLIQSVDREKLAVELNRCLVGQPRQDILMQVYVGDEATKHGITLEQGYSLLEKLSAFPNLRVRGLMSLPPLIENEAVARGYFAQIREAFEKWKAKLPTEIARDFNQLSLGTSSDYEAAILEGATLVRVGTAIFGSRAARGRA